MSTPTHANAPSPLGLLGVFPREIRDEIYKQLFCGPHKVGNWRHPRGIAFSAQKCPCVNIFETSETVQFEALEAFYAHSIFEIDLNEGVDLLGHIERMRNFHLCLTIHPEDRDVDEEQLKDVARAYHKATLPFCGNEIPRAECRVFIRMSPRSFLCERPFENHVPYLADALKGLIGFRRISINVTWDREEHNASQLVMLFVASLRLKSFKNVALEPSLGSSTNLAKKRRLVL